MDEFLARTGATFSEVLKTADVLCDFLVVYTNKWSSQYGSGDATFDLIICGGILGTLLSLLSTLASNNSGESEDTEQDKISTKPVSSKAQSLTALASDKRPSETSVHERLGRSRGAFWSKIKSALGAGGRVNAANLEELEMALIGSDIGPAITGQLLLKIREKITKENLHLSLESLQELLSHEIESILKKSAVGDATTKEALVYPPVGPLVIMVIGVNGAGKTTTVAKLAHRFKLEEKKVLLVAADTFRAAAIEQLEQWGRRAGVPVVRGPDGCKPAGVVFDGVKRAQDEGFDVVLLDTAGRLHTKTNLMQELEGIKNAVSKQVPAGPHETWLVIDGTSGQNGLVQAQQFNQSVKLTGIIVTKLDSSSKGGGVVAIASELGTPVRFIGFGEGEDDLRPFDAHEFSKAMFSLPPEVQNPEEFPSVPMQRVM
jgi:fused signal recognition particle receptor